MSKHNSYCKQCGGVLPENNMWFCNIDCEIQFREDNQEFHAIIIPNEDRVTIEEICPVIEFNDDMENNCLVIHNGSYEYKFNKKDIIKWEITPCTCLAEFMDIERWK